jgi:beta-lactamase regulating signal transducer with metallopeptidase domain/HEAT repeat protein
MNMETLFQIGLVNAAAAAALALVVLGVSVVVRRPALLHALWLIVVLKLLTPPLATVPVGGPAVRESNTAVFGLPPPAADAAAVPVSSPRADAAPSPAANPPAARRETAAAAWPRISLVEALGIAWLIGSAAVVLLAAAQSLRFARLLRRGKPAPAETAAEALEIARRLGLRRAPRIDLVPGAVSPLLWWVPGRAARIVLPAGLWSRFDADSRRTVLAHEIAHFARRDHWVRWLELAAAALYWWHPAVWIARREIRRTEDAACDAWVVWAFPESARAYGAALVETVDFLVAGRRPALLPGSGIGGARGLKRRLAGIARGTGPRALSRGGWLIVVLAAAAVLPFVPGRAEEKPEDPSSKRIVPKPVLKGEKATIAQGETNVLDLVRFLADHSGLPVILDSSQRFLLEKKITVPTKLDNATSETVQAILEENGFSVERSVLQGGDTVITVKPSQRALHERIDKLEGKLDQALKDLEALRGRAGTSKDFNYKGKPIAEWVRDLADRDPGTRDAAINVMSGLRDAVPQLIEAMKSEDVVLRQNAIEALRRTGGIDGPAAGAILRALNDPEKQVRDAAAGWDGSWGVRMDAAPVLHEALKDPSPLVRSTAARALGRVEWPYSVKPDGTMDFVAERAAAVPPLAAALEDPDPEVRRRAASALRVYGEKATQAAPGLAKLLDDPEGGIALEAAWTLAEVAPGAAPERATTRLVAGLDEEDEHRRAMSARALGRLGPAARSAVQRLLAIAESQGEDQAPDSVRGWAAVALAAIDPEAATVNLALRALTQAIKYRGDSDLRLAALDALGALGPLAKSAVPALENKLVEGSTSRPARTTVRRTVPSTGKARPAAPDPEREKAAEALKKIRGE